MHIKFICIRVYAYKFLHVKHIHICVCMCSAFEIYMYVLVCVCLNTHILYLYLKLFCSRLYFSIELYCYVDVQIDLISDFISRYADCSCSDICPIAMQFA